VWIFESARDHDVDEEDSSAVADDPVVVVPLAEDPYSEMRLGFDTKGRALEVGVEQRPFGWVMFHADKITQQYEVLLEEAL